GTGDARQDVAHAYVAVRLARHAAVGRGPTGARRRRRVLGGAAWTQPDQLREDRSWLRHHASDLGVVHSVRQRLSPEPDRGPQLTSHYRGQLHDRLRVRSIGLVRTART